MLSAHSLRYYIDSGAEEASLKKFLSITSYQIQKLYNRCKNCKKVVFLLKASHLVGEIDLTTCHRITELHDQRNFGFEIRVCQIIQTFYNNR